jgi:hypothetical protein
MGKSGLQVTTPGKATVAATSTLVLAANEDREFMSFTNDSDEVMYLTFNGIEQSAAAVMNEGEPLYPAQTVSFSVPVIPKGNVYAICSSGSKNITTFEGT